MFTNVTKTKSYFLYLGVVLCLSCTISVLPFAKVYAKESPSTYGTPARVSLSLEGTQQEPPSLQKKSKKHPTGSTDNSIAEKPLDQPAISSPETGENKQGNKKTLMIVGAGAAAAAVLALALSGGGGGGGPAQTEPEVEPVGADLAGNWSGYLELVNHSRENITAVVVQNGSQVEITTSSTQPYGKIFKGTINSSRKMSVIDQTTGEIWTTFKGPAFPTQIDLYDYVNNFTGLDRLFLKR